MSFIQSQVKPQEQPKLPWPKKVLFGALYAVFMVFTLLCLGEVAVRVFSLLVVSFESSPFRQYDPELGVSLIANKHVSHHRDCFRGEVVVNRWGMRDRDRSLAKGPQEFRIALLGDSTVEGVHVRPDEVVNIRVEKLLQQKGYKNAEVFNFGVAGIGTTQELLMYKQRVRRFHPDLVILLFVLNDVMNNSSTLQPKVYGIHTWYAPYYDLGPDGKLAFRPVEPRAWNKLRSFLETHSALTYYLERAWLRVNFSLYKWHGIPIEWGVFGDPLDGEWKQAWLITEKVLALFHETVLNDGVRFIVLVAPEFHQIDPNWKQRFVEKTGEIPPAFNPSKYEERLSQIASRNHIPLDFLATYIRFYRDRHSLQWPYFSLACDPHLSPLGHQVAAEAIVQKLEEHRLLPALDESTIR